MWRGELEDVVDDAIVTIIHTAIRWRLAILIVFYFKCTHQSIRSTLYDTGIYFLTLVIADMIYYNTPDSG